MSRPSASRGAPSFNFTEVRSPLVYEEGALTLPDLRANLTGGQVQAQASVKTESPDAPYSVSLKVESVDLGRLAADSGWPPQSGRRERRAARSR